MRSVMGNEVSTGEGEREDGGSRRTDEEEDGCEVSGGLWVMSQDVEDGEEVCVFTCLASSSSQTERCMAGAEHLRLLRHPNILKFLSYDVIETPVSMVTEAVVSVRCALRDSRVEGVVTGWRGVAQGLGFLHKMAGLSHNSLCCECVFVSSSNSQWKIGGFEAAALHAKMDSKFIASIAVVRAPSTIPPEDKSPSPPTHVPVHSRDVWAFGHFMITTLEEAQLETSVSDSLFSYVKEHMLNSNPSARPTTEAVLSQFWMRNEVTEIADFLSHLTMKTQSEKDHFFDSLPPRLLFLPSSVVAEHLVPLLLTPLVMAEPVANRLLWQHLLTPVSVDHPKQLNFDPLCRCPILEKDLFISLVLPLLLNLMECREYHVRMILLRNLMNFSPLCPHEELISSVLPEVLIGLHDAHDEMVKETLSALAGMVLIVGGDAVMGSTRSSIFADTTPRANGVGVASPSLPSGSSPSPPPTPPPPSSALLPSSAPPKPSQEELRRQRAERMREKREIQRQKRLAKTKLGVASSAVELEVPKGAEPSLVTLPNTNHAQYSPSISHDEEERENMEEGRVGSDGSPQSAGVRAEQEEEEGSEDEWEGFGEEEEWEGGEEEEEGKEEGGEREKSTFSDVNIGWQLGNAKLPVKEINQKSSQSPLTSPSGARGALKLGGKVRAVGDGKERKSEKEDGQGGGGGGGGGGRSGRSWMKEEDVQRLAEQEAWQKEPDFFVDMEPAIAQGSLSPKKAPPSALAPASVSIPVSTRPGTRIALEYQPTGKEVTQDGGWGNDSWNDF